MIYGMVWYGMICCLVDWLVGGLVGWEVVLAIRWLVDVGCSIARRLSYCLVNSVTDWLADVFEYLYLHTVLRDCLFVCFVIVRLMVCLMVESMY